MFKQKSSCLHQDLNIRSLAKIHTHTNIGKKHPTSVDFNTIKYHVSCTDGKISVGIIYFYHLFFHNRPIYKLCFLSCRPFIVNAKFSTGLVVSSVSWFGQLTVNDERPTGKKTELVSGMTVEKYVIKINNSISGFLLLINYKM